MISAICISRIILEGKMDILAVRRARDAERKRRKRAEEREKRLSAPVSNLRPSEGSPACDTAPGRTETAKEAVIPDNVVEDTIDAFDAFAMLKARREKEYGR